MKRSKRFFLPADDCDRSLIRAQMSQKFVTGTGFCSSKEGAIIDPAEIVGSGPTDISKAVEEEHRRVLLESLNDLNR